jgi:hypothetical protein
MRILIAILLKLCSTAPNASTLYDMLTKMTVHVCLSVPICVAYRQVRRLAMK